MKLEFALLVVDDVPDNVEQAINILDDHLNTKGFSLERKIAGDLSEQGVQELARSQGSNYDLVMVDYNLGQDGRDGALVAHQLRRELPYVDMVFYSSISVSQLLAHLAAYEVSGVFAERREDLGDALAGLADTVIGKAVDLNHMRGIAMAEVAEMDVLMERTLARVFRPDNEQIQAARERTIARLREGMNGNLQRFQELLDEGGLPSVVRDDLLFSLAKKYQAIRRVARLLPEERRQGLDALGSYDEDIIQKRNLLAHVREESNEDGTAILRSIGHNQDAVTIDEEWMSGFRHNLREHMSALTIVCEALNRHFGAAEAAHDAEERQP